MNLIRQFILNTNIRFNTNYTLVNKCVYATKTKQSKKQQKNVNVDYSPTDEDDEHIFNIYASIKEDHELLPDEAYPDWLWQLDKPDKSYGELIQMFVYGKDIENSKMSDYNRFRRLHNRYMIKLNNIRLQKRRKLTFSTHLWDV
ncbi:hypothetical protein MACK_004040 [Theileria orientalis]|uniref:Large ribosomal subunit protein mL54 n=1 Tax=Theileria orientalis TaxID=68886 RepID=A0A976SJR1_THEOR|nr:hypothetical protein MACK_004040 [Theileria orientalis]